MDNFYADGVFLFEVLGEVLGTIDGTMLTAGAAEGDLKMGEIAFDEALDMMVDEGIDGVEEGEYLTVVLQEVNDGLVKACEGLVLLVFARVVGGTAIKDITSSVAGFVDRQTAFIRERVDRY